MGMLADRQSQLLIDGKLVAGQRGHLPDCQPGHRGGARGRRRRQRRGHGPAIEAARRAFDETDWSTNTELRVRCMRQLQQTY